MLNFSIAVLGLVEDSCQRLIGVRIAVIPLLPVPVEALNREGIQGKYINALTSNDSNLYFLPRHLNRVPIVDLPMDLFLATRMPPSRVIIHDSLLCFRDYVRLPRIFTDHRNISTYRNHLPTDMILPRDSAGGTIYSANFGAICLDVEGHIFSLAKTDKRAILNWEPYPSSCEQIDLSTVEYKQSIAYQRGMGIPLGERTGYWSSDAITYVPPLPYVDASVLFENTHCPTVIVPECGWVLTPSHRGDGLIVHTETVVFPTRMISLHLSPYMLLFRGTKEFVFPFEVICSLVLSIELSSLITPVSLNCHGYLDASLTGSPLNDINIHGGDTKVVLKQCSLGKKNCIIRSDSNVEFGAEMSKLPKLQIKFDSPSEAPVNIGVHFTHSYLGSDWLRLVPEHRDAKLRFHLSLFHTTTGILKLPRLNYERITIQYSSVLSNSIIDFGDNADTAEDSLLEIIAAQHSIRLRGALSHLTCVADGSAPALDMSQLTVAALTLKRICGFDRVVLPACDKLVIHSDIDIHTLVLPDTLKTIIFGNDGNGLRFNIKKVVANDRVFQLFISSLSRSKAKFTLFTPPNMICHRHIGY